MMKHIDGILEEKHGGAGAATMDSAEGAVRDLKAVMKEALNKTGWHKEGKGSRVK